MYLRELQKLEEERSFGELFCPVSQRVQMNLILYDNVQILYLLFTNVKKPKTTKIPKYENKNKKTRGCLM